MKENIVKNLIASLKDTDIVELTFEKGDFKIAFRRDEQMLELKRKPQKRIPAAPSKEEESPMFQKTFKDIKSTMVGTFYSSPSPDRPPLVIEGDHVMPGQKVGMIEAMKVMKDVISTVQGKVERVLIQNGHAVEYGQPLFRIDTTNHNSKV